MFKKFIHDESGATAIEYGLIAVMLSLAIFAGILKMQTSILNLFTEPTNALNQALTP